MRVLLALTFLLASPHALAQAAVPPELDRLVDHFAELYGKGDVEGLVSLYAAAATHVPLVGAARLDGHAGVRGDYQRVFAASRSRDITTLSQRWQVVGDVAIRTADVFIDQQSPDGSPVGTRARLTLVFGRDGGTWKIVHQHGSLATPPKAPAAEPAWGQCGRP